MNAQDTKPIAKKGRPPNQIQVEWNEVGLTVHQWKLLRGTGNASHTLRKLLAQSGYPEQPITT